MITFYSTEQVDFMNGVQPVDDLEPSDYRTLKLSKSLGTNITPLIHFWGIHPVNPSRLQQYMDLYNLQLSDVVRNHLYKYVSMIPKRNHQFKSYAYSIYPELVNNSYCRGASPLYGCGWFRSWQDKYTWDNGPQAISAGEAIIEKYYGPKYVQIKNNAAGNWCLTTKGTFNGALIVCRKNEECGIESIIFRTK